MGSTSGYLNFNPFVTDIIRDAYRVCLVINPDEQPTDSMYESGLTSMNRLVVEMQADQIHVWTEEEAILFVQPGVARYLIGGPDYPADLDAAPPTNVCAADDYVQTTLALPALAGATAIVLTLADGIAAGDFIGVMTNAGVLFWTKVLEDPVMEIVTLAADLPDNCDAGAFVFAYTTKLARPLNIPNARMLQFYGANETPMTRLSRQEYMDLPNKLSGGMPSQFFYNPGRDQGQLFLWTAPRFANVAIRFTWYRPLQTFLQPNNTADFPQEWANCLKWCLAMELMVEWSTPQKTQDLIAARARDAMDRVKGWDTETADIQFEYGYPTGRA